MEGRASGCQEASHAGCTRPGLREGTLCQSQNLRIIGKNGPLTSEERTEERREGAIEKTQREIFL